MQRYSSLSHDMHAHPMENRAEQWSLIITHIYHCFGNSYNSVLPLFWALLAAFRAILKCYTLCLPLVINEATWQRASLCCQRTSPCYCAFSVTVVSLSLMFYTQDTIHFPLKTQVIVCKKYLHSSSQTLSFSNLVHAIIILSTVCWITLPWYLNARSWRPH